MHASFETKVIRLECLFLLSLICVLAPLQLQLSCEDTGHHDTGNDSYPAIATHDTSSRQCSTATCIKSLGAGHQLCAFGDHANNGQATRCDVLARIKPNETAGQP